MLSLIYFLKFRLLHKENVLAFAVTGIKPIKIRLTLVDVGMSQFNMATVKQEVVLAAQLHVVNNTFQSCYLSLLSFHVVARLDHR